MNAILYEWLTPQGILAAGVVVGVIQQRVDAFLAARAVRELKRASEAAHVIALAERAKIAEAALAAHEKIDEVSVDVKQMIIQTNGMSERLQAIAGEAGEVRGRADEKAERAERDKL
jgi:hypothetical protein